MLCKENLSIKTLVVLSLLSLGVLILTGCSKTKKSSSPEKKASEETLVEKNEQKPKSESGNKQKIIMMGRSVMYGWFEHWGSDSSKPVKKGDYVFYYKELDTPPGIVDSAKKYTEEIKDGQTIVFFKFCFDDFGGGNKSEAKSNLSDNKKYILQVYDEVVKERGLRLIIGNVLPKVKASTDPNLVWNHRSFNKWLDQFAHEHSGEVYVFDEYSVLVDSKGNLNNQYSLNKEDSHPNNEAYSALDDAFFDFLNKNF